jgi:hypothetical protein
MTPASEKLEKVKARGKRLLLACGRWHNAWVSYFATVQPCDDEKGFAILDQFRKHVETFVFGYGRKDVGVKHAADELFRLTATGQADYTYDEALAFVVWYDQLKGRIENSIGHLFDFHGDSFGDLCDSLPLAGREIVERCLASHKKSGKRREGFLNEDEISQAITSDKWRNFCNGENYVEMALSTQAENWFLHTLKTGEDAGWTVEEQKILSWASLPGDD